VGDFRGNLKVWSIADAREVTSISLGQDVFASQLCFTNDARYLFASTDDKIRIWKQE
jgi:hypothetical protein